MVKCIRFSLVIVAGFALCISCTQKERLTDQMKNVYPWCIVAFDSLERSPDDRIKMLKELGFTKYAYDWRDPHLDDMSRELQLAEENGIEIISSWLWLNAERDSLGKLSPGNERMLQILKDSQIKTTLWLSFSNNFFEDKSQEESLTIARNMIQFIKHRADALDCSVALYNHRGWFGNPNNQLQIIKSMPSDSLSMVFNFHHAHDYLDDFPKIAKMITPHLSAVNLNGMTKDGEKIVPFGAGEFEKTMINSIRTEGFHGPWGLLGHVENADVKEILEQNIAGLNSMEILQK